MATEKWQNGSGVGLTWTNAFGSEINSIATGNSILSSVSVVNGSPTLDMFADVSFVAGATVTTAAPAFIAIYLYPLNEDGVTYGDGRFGSSTAGTPSTNYLVGSFGFNNAAGTTISGVITGILLPPGTFSFLLNNQSGATLASSNTCKYRTYNRQVT